MKDMNWSFLLADDFFSALKQLVSLNFEIKSSKQSSIWKSSVLAKTEDFHRLNSFAAPHASKKFVPPTLKLKSKGKSLRNMYERFLIFQNLSRFENVISQRSLDS